MKRAFLLLCCGIILLTNSISAYAAPDEYMVQREERKALPISTNAIENWPEGPQIGAYSAILMEMNTHTILYAKNIDEKMYPASTTKILTCLLAAQNCELNENVTFSYDAVHDVPRDGSNMGMDAGEVITMEQALYGVLVGSANEAASAVGEHVAKNLGLEPTVDNFVELMNEKAKALGCKNTHFTNSNGLFDENHYTSAYDLALIGCEFFQNETLCKMSSTNRYHIPATSTQPDDIWLVSKNQLLKDKTYEYPYLLGSKTGYVSQSRENLVSAATKDGMSLVCVIFMEESPYQFEDTVTLFQYGFENFKALKLSEYESSFQVTKDFPFTSSTPFFTKTDNFFHLDQDATIILPKSATYEDVSSTITYHDVADDLSFADMQYTFSDTRVGNCALYLNEEDFIHSDSDENPQAKDSFFQKIVSLKTTYPDSEYEKHFLFFNVKYFLLFLVACLIGLVLLFYLLSYISGFHFSNTRPNDRRRKSRQMERRQREKAARKKRKEEKKLNRMRRNAYKKRKK